MATGGIEMQSTECPVCHENYHEPKILPCAHLLCRGCLVSWMKKKTDALCPLCRSAIVEREDVNSGNCEDIVDSLLTDHAMSAMVESVEILNEKRVCHMHRAVGATSLCLHCNLKLCKSCVEVHKNLPVTSFHKVEDLGTITLECLASNRQEPCSDHPDKTSELFCTAHNVLICHLCATSKHRTCPEVTCLKEVNEKYKQTLSDIKVKLTATVSGLNRAITQIEKHLAASEKNTQAAFKQIDATCNALLNSVETCRKRLKKIVQDADDKIKATALEQKSSVDKRRGTLTSHLNLIERVQNTSHGSSLVAMVPNLENRIAKLDLDAPVPTGTGQDFQMVRLTIDRQTVVHVEQALERIGELSLSPASRKGLRFSHLSPLEGQNRYRRIFPLMFSDVKIPSVSKSLDKSVTDLAHLTDEEDPEETCPICLEVLEHPCKLQCGHMFCKRCIDRALNIAPSCPKCQCNFGIPTGNQPEDGKMSYRISSTIKIPGVSQKGAIVIDYYFPDGTQQACHPQPGKRYKGIFRTAYLPNTVEGQEVLKMLENAFKHRLVFTFGDFRTTGASDVLTWNDIHHKTNVDGGPSNFGYPDPDYLKRVKKELAAKGITSQ